MLFPCDYIALSKVNASVQINYLVLQEFYNSGIDKEWTKWQTIRELNSRLAA